VIGRCMTKDRTSGHQVTTCRLGEHPVMARQRAITHHHQVHIHRVAVLVIGQMKDHHRAMAPEARTVVHRACGRVRMGQHQGMAQPGRINRMALVRATVLLHMATALRLDMAWGLHHTGMDHRPGMDHHRMGCRRHTKMRIHRMERGVAAGASRTLEEHGPFDINRMKIPSTSYNTSGMRRPAHFLLRYQCLLQRQYLTVQRIPVSVAIRDQ